MFLWDFERLLTFQHRSIRRWDQKQKKFVRLGQIVDEARNEAGARIKKNERQGGAADPYLKWCSKNKKSIPEVGATLPMVVLTLLTSEGIGGIQRTEQRTCTRRAAEQSQQ